jgi:hypothetical protein
VQKGYREQDQKYHPHGCAPEWMSFEKAIRRHPAKDENPKNDHQRVAGRLCNACNIDHLVFSEIADLLGAPAAFIRYAGRQRIPSPPNTSPIGSVSGADTFHLVRYRAGSIETTPARL